MQNQTQLVLVHGWCGNQSMWKYQLDYFQGRHPVHTLNLRGHGDAAPHEEYSIHGFADDVVALLEQKQLHNVVLVGHSMGGAVCCEAAARLPQRVKAVIMADTFLYDYGFFSEEDIEETLAGLRKDLRATIQGLINQVVPESQPQVLKNYITQSLSQTPVGVAVPAFDSLLRWNLVGLLPHVHVPLHAINGDLVSPVAGKRYQHVIKEHRLDGTGHFLHMEAPERFNAVVELILRDMGESAPAMA